MIISNGANKVILMIQNDPIKQEACLLNSRDAEKIVPLEINKKKNYSDEYYVPGGHPLRARRQ